MKFKILNFIKPVVGVVMAAVMLASCNKDLPEAEPIITPAPTGSSINTFINDVNYSLLKAAVTRAGLTSLLADSTAVFTFFAPDNAAFNSIGITSAAMINAMPAAQVASILQNHIIGGQKLTSANISTTFPNMYLQSSLVLQAPSATLPPGLRMPIFPSKRGNTMWVNNIPVTQQDIAVSNGVIHRIASVILPSQQFLWNRIDTAADLTYLKAAIKRADAAVPAGGTKLEDVLKNPAANLTVFAPTDAAFRALLTAQITAALMAQGMDAATAQATATVLASTPDVFTNPAVATVLTAQTVQGILFYHVLGVRAFTVNFPTTATLQKTLLNNAVAAHPGVALQATFAANGLTVTSATVKGAANATASNILLNPTPSTSTTPPAGTSDQNYINGVLHKIDQVLRPQ